MKQCNHYCTDKLLLEHFPSNSFGILDLLEQIFITCNYVYIQEKQLVCPND